MEISNRITNEISGMTKAKIGSAVVSVRSIFEAPMMQQRLPMNSPLMKSTGINRLRDMVKPLHEENKTSTPSMPSRSGPLGLASDAPFGMNKIKRKDTSPTKGLEKLDSSDNWQRSMMFQPLTARDRDKDALKKPPLPGKLVKDDGVTKEHSDSKINTTTETTPDVKQLSERKFNPPIEIEQEVRETKKTEPRKEEKTTTEERKHDDNLKKFNQLSLPEETKNMMENRSSLSQTPGFKARRLTRVSNTEIDPLKKPAGTMGALPEISLTKPKPAETAPVPEEVKNPVPVGDPLMKFCKSEENKNDKRRDSLNFLKQLGGGNSKEQPKKDNSVMELPEIPEFKPKSHDLTLDRKTKSTQESNGSKRDSKKLSQSLKDIPIVDQSKDKKHKKEGVASPILLKKDSMKSGKDPTEKKPVKEESKVASTLNKIASAKKSYGTLAKKYKILSIIQEENKPLAEFMPTEEITPTPYARNLVINDERRMIFYSNKVAESLTGNQEKKTYLTRNLYHNREILKEVKSKKFTSRKKINWTLLDTARNVYVLLNERRIGRKLSYVEQQFNTILKNIPKDE